MPHPFNVVYILLHFPYLTETFVAEEIEAVKAQGLKIQIISLLPPGPGPVQPLSQQLLPYTSYAAGLLKPKLWLAQLYFLSKSFWLYLSLLVTLLKQPYPKQPIILWLKRLVIFLKAVAVAYDLKDKQVHLFHAHFAWLSGAAAWICARLLNLPFTVTVHAYDLFLSNDLLPLVSRQANQVMAISEYNRQKVLDTGACPMEKIAVIRCGINSAYLQENKALPRQKLEPDAPIRILSVGSLLPKKGHLYLISACHILKQQGINFYCTVIGSGYEESALRQQIQTLGLQEQVELQGARPNYEIKQAYQQHDIFVLPSVITSLGDRDGIPVVLMEAGACGLPLISTQVSGIPELVRHNQTGWLVPPRNAPALAQAITTLATKPELCAQLSQNARKLIETEYSVEKNAIRMVNLWQHTYQQWLSGQTPIFR
jgi:glycosyltransferase involved in cell wall biosynthesis